MAVPLMRQGVGLLPAASREGDTRERASLITSTGDEAGLGMTCPFSGEAGQKTQPGPFNGE